ncbi:TetR family transcriptional regulator [Vibrio coralliilyticus]|uniref:TetR/AcrR family transcriptional regulator n=1 Tax=Vibrio coralliilyticus TaxID=190893 RepID=UPI000BAC2900|nr:TetR family transcriptional regulator [Vibrio coralliilyticus]NOI78196.1 TetR family transcriptional regulator [Vibrio coralliilyticus]PAW01442.1 TetR family transcriptional regulator [Vibrio coralliilyticus]
MTVKRKRGRPAGEKAQLGEERILSVAKSMMKEQGKIPSIRALASELDVDAMAIYYYFKNKGALLEAITVSLIEDIYLPKTNENWQHELTQLATSYVQLLKSYPGLLTTLLSMESVSPAMVFIERFKSIIAPLSLSEAEERNAIDLLADYLHGFALALNCNPNTDQLDENMMTGPLSLYFRALMSGQ